MQCCVTTTQLPAIRTFNCKDAILCSQISRFGNAKWVSLTPGWACIPCGSTCIQCRPCSGATVSWVRLLSRSVVPLEASTRSTLSSVLPLPYWPKRDTSIMFSVREVVKIWGPELNLPGKAAKAAPPPDFLHSGSMGCCPSYTFTSTHLLRDTQITSWQWVSANILYRHLTLLPQKNQWKGFVQHSALPRSSPLWPESLRCRSETCLFLVGATKQAFSDFNTHSIDPWPSAWHCILKTWHHSAQLLGTSRVLLPWFS